MTKSTVHKDNDKDSLPETGAAAKAAFPELFKTENAIIVQPKKPLSLETASSELYAAVINGEIHNVRAQLAHADKVTEAEATMMIRTRNKAREKGAKRLAVVECITEKRKGKKKADAYIAQAVEAGKFKQVTTTGKPGPSVTGGVVDLYGGRYSAGGYEMPDGSYLSTSGEFYNAISNILTLSDGKSYKMATDLPMSIASIIYTAQKVRSVRNSAPVTELDFIPAAIEPATIEVVADAANLAAAAADAHAAEIMQEEAFAEESRKAPAAAINQLDGMPGLSAEDIHIAIQIHRRALRENRSAELLTEDDCREILDIRDGLACVDTSSMRRCRSHGDEREGLSIRFNPHSHQPVVIEAVCDLGRSIKACFQKAGNTDKAKVVCTAKPKLAVA